jgi:DNA-binding response OmpR family regulator
MMRKRILLVDDEQAIQRLVAATLGRVDFDLTVASNGFEAVDAAMARPPDLVLLDVTMPEMDGFAVATTLRGNPGTAHVPIIMLSARGSADDVAHGRAIGVDEYLIKPFSPLRLLNKVYDLLSEETPALGRPPASAGS